MPRTFPFRRMRALSGATCPAALLAVAFAGSPAHAQDGGGQRFTFGIEQRFEVGRNTDLSFDSEGTSATATTIFSLGVVDETALERVVIDASVGLVIERTPDSDGTEVDIGSPGLDFTYVREVPDASLTLGASYIRDDVADLADDLTDADAEGTQTNYGLRARYETFRTAPASLFLEAAFDGERYEDTIDPGLVDTDTVTLTIGSNLRFSDVLTGTVSASREREEDEAGTVSTTDSLTAGLVYAMANGSASLQVGHEQSDDETRNSLTVGRSLEVATGSLSVTLGVTDSDAGGSDVIGSIRWTQQLGAGTMSVELDGPKPTTTFTGSKSLKASAGKRSSVMRVPATGDSVLTRTLYFAPSRASVLVRPARPSFAAP